MLKKRSSRLIFLCWLLYTVAYLGRYSLNANITLIEDFFQIPHADMGLVTTCFFISYGIGQVVHGMLSRYYNKRIILTTVFVISAALNLCIFFGIPFVFFKYLWFINGAVQSVLWSSLVAVLAENLDKGDLNRAILVMATTTSAGTFLSYGAASLLALTKNFKLSFLLGAVTMLATAFLWFLLYNGCRQPESEKAAEAPLGDALPSEAPTPSETKSRLPLAVLSLIVILALFAVFDNLIKDGLQTWVPAVLKESFGLNDSLSVILTLVLPILGIFGALFSTRLYTRIPSFVSVAGLFFVLSALCLFGVILLFNTSLWWAVLLLFGVINLCMHGVNNVITSMTPMMMRDTVDSGRLAGILNGCCYIGSAISSYLLGFVADAAGWSFVFVLLFAICIFAVFLFLCYLAALFFSRKKAAV